MRDEVIERKGGKVLCDATKESEVQRRFVRGIC